MKAPLQGLYCVCGGGCQCNGVGLTCVAARPIHIDTASFCIARNIRRQRLQNAETDKATSIRLASLSVSCRATEVKKAWLQHSSSHKVSGAVPSEPRVGTTTTSKQLTDKCCSKTRCCLILSISGGPSSIAVVRSPSVPQRSTVESKSQTPDDGVG